MHLFLPLRKQTHHAWRSCCLPTTNFSFGSWARRSSLAGRELETLCAC